MKGPLEERFAAKIDKSGECWEWTASINGAGYGQIGNQGTVLLAHRVAYELENGPIPDGLVIDHICRRRSCVRPSHLRAVTQKQNAENAPSVTGSTTGIRGVYPVTKSGKFAAIVIHNRERHYIGGHFATVAEAEAAVIAKRNELHTCNELDRISA